MTPYRSRPYLDLSYAPGKGCIICGKPCEPAHYNGMGAHHLGRGAAQKASDLTVADYCRAHHTEADTYAGDKASEVRAFYFLLDCWRTLLRNIDAGLVTLEVHAEPVQRPERRERVAGRKTASRCTRSSKTVPRPEGWQA